MEQMKMKIFKIILAFILLVPIILTSGGLFLLFAIYNIGDGRTEEEWKAYMWSKWYIRPAMWLHAWLLCGGDYSKQRR